MPLPAEATTAKSVDFSFRWLFLIDPTGQSCDHYFISSLWSLKTVIYDFMTLDYIHETI